MSRKMKLLSFFLTDATRPVSRQGTGCEQAPDSQTKCLILFRREASALGERRLTFPGLRCASGSGHGESPSQDVVVGRDDPRIDLTVG